MNSKNGNKDGNENDISEALEALKINDGVDTNQISSKSKNSHGVSIVTGFLTDKTYSMDYPKRGRCLIFNHKKFKSHTGFPTRHGTDADADRLNCIFTNLQFEVTIFTDLKVEEVDQELNKAGKENHESNSCFVCCILSHGDQGVLCATDGTYPTDNVFAPFRGDVCPTLVGKPKIFFIQACQGDKLDSGIAVSFKEYTDSFEESISSVKIPICADFLIVYSAVPGYFSWRNESGSWFIQALCEALHDYAKDLDLMSILTIVNYKVAYNFESYSPKKPEYHSRKIVPSINSTLTRVVKFSQ